MELPIVRRLLALPAGWQDRPAFASATASLRFGALRDGMLRVGGWLTQQGVRPGDRVALCLPKGFEAVLAIHGVLAVGAAYVPLAFPALAPRLAASLRSVRPMLLLTTPATAAELAAEGPDLTGIEIRTLTPTPAGDGLAPLLGDIPALARIAPVRPDDLAAVFFTSGSTGEPNGVMLSHANMAATLGWLRRRDEIVADDRLISHGRLHYVGSFDLFQPLANGCRLFLMAERETMFPERVAARIVEEGITIWSSTSTALRLLAEGDGGALENAGALRMVRFFGEPLPIAVLRALMDRLPRTRFVNSYGATEVYNIAYYVVPRPLPADLAAIPVGRPSDICELTLRDEAGLPVPRGTVGEICIAGPSVMLGYWNDPALTARKRLPGRANSFRTGDLGIQAADGLLRLVGRHDHVVKLRGHRFDLGEIEALLKNHPAVRDAIAFAIPHDGVHGDAHGGARDHGGSEIRVAVLEGEAAGGAELAAALRRLCRTRLRALYAWPARLQLLSRFPILPTGKVDRRALQAELAAG